MNDKVKKKKVVSFSQFSMWYTCPYHWKLDYLDGLKKFEESLNMSFGTAIHKTMQLYLKILFHKSEDAANKINMMKYFKWAFNQEVTKKKIPHTPEQLGEFIDDGENILNTFSQFDNRLKHFPTDKYTLVDIEHELKIDIKNNVDIIAYLDLVFKEKETGKIKIVDIKTSTRGWSTYEKEDITKQSQLRIYKALYSKKYNIPLHMIDVEFFIVKRKLYENVTYDQSHIQIFKPSHTQQDIFETVRLFSNFVNSCFTLDGNYKLDVKYPKIPGKSKKNCKWCPHKKIKCDTIPDII